MKNIFALAALLLLIPLHFHAQTIRWEEEAKRTYIYEISNDEAEKLVKSWVYYDSKIFF